MKVVCSIEIDKPAAGLADLMTDFTKSPSWMADLSSCKMISGQPGGVGSKAAMTFTNGKRVMTFTATLVAKDVPRMVRSELESSMLHIEAIATFQALNQGKTLLKFEQNFTFKGFAKLAGYIMKSQIKNQQQEHIAGFKRFAESLT